MADPITTRLNFARSMGRNAGQKAHGFFSARDTLVIEAKASPQDIVSRADREVEQIVRDAIANEFPDDAILGEEGGATDGTSGFTWVIDPIDGTSPFLAGLPHWCVALALVQGEETVAGVIDVPMAQEQFSARRGEGAWLNDKPMRINAAAKLSNSLVAIGASHRTDPAQASQMINDLMSAGGMFYRNGSGALMLAYVAAGRLGGYCESHMHVWDCLAGMLMVEEAGGRVGPYPALSTGGRVVVTAPGVWNDLAKITG